MQSHKSPRNVFTHRRFCWIVRIPTLAVVAAVTAGIAFGANSAMAQTVVLTKVIENGDPVPDGSGDTFTSLQTPVLDQGVIVFAGSPATLVRTANGVFEPLADRNTLAPPSTTETFTFLSDPSIRNGVVSFFGLSDGTFDGVYLFENGALSLVADEATNSPGTSSPLSGFGAPKTDGSIVAFVARAAGIEGLYRASAAGLELVLDETTPLPDNSGTFGNLSNSFIAADGGDVAFLTDFGFRPGFLYRTRGAAVEVVADPSTPFPGGGFFDFVDEVPSFAQGMIAFDGSNGMGSGGIIVDTGSGFRLAVEGGTPVPGSSEVFTLFRQMSLDSGRVAFDGIFGQPPNSTRGLFVESNGTIIPVVALGDMLDGKLISQFAIDSRALSGNELVFHVRFDGGGQAIYLATISFVLGLECAGFEAPLDDGPVTVKKNKVLPLKAELLDSDGFPVTDEDLDAQPVIQVLYDSGVGGEEPVDVTEDALPAGQGTEGNEFVFSGSKWQFNLKTKNYSAPGTYLISIVSGDEDEYVIAPTCTAEFVIE